VRHHSQGQGDGVGGAGDEDEDYSRSVGDIKQIFSKQPEPQVPSYRGQ